MDLLCRPPTFARRLLDIFDVEEGIAVQVIEALDLI
jgi:hypothetical protein